MGDSLRERFLILDDFLANDEARMMRTDIDAHFSNPRRHEPATHQIWNYWHVPGSYTYLRTRPEKVIAREKVQTFVDAVRVWASVNLGLSSVSWPYLSMYVPGCAQGVHNDSLNGQFGYVYSLTRQSRHTVGGETVLFHDCDLFRSNLDRAAAGTGLFDRIDPRFNRLTIFDDRVPHAVQRIDGSMNPMDARFVLHGHISEAGVVAEGALTGREIWRSASPAVERLRLSLATIVNGPIVYSIKINSKGNVQQTQILVDRLASPGGQELTTVREAIHDMIASLRFPKRSADTFANVPLVF